MSEGFDLGAYLQEAGVKMDTGKEKQIEKISIDLIHPHPGNFYSIEGIDEMAQSILNIGLLDPIVVVENVDGSCTIVSGHRRWNAFKKLIADGHEEFRDVPCIVDRDPNNTPDLIKLKLLYANSVTRKMSDPDKLEQQKQVTEVLVKLKGEGYEFKGKLRDHVAQLCQTSATNIARLKVIDDKLIDKIKVKWRNGAIATSIAYRIAQLDPEYQDLMSTALSSNKLTRESEVSLYKEAFEKLQSIQGCKVSGASNCQHIKKMLRRTAGTNTWQRCPGCCVKCTSLINCKSSCQLANAEKERQQKKIADRMENVRQNRRKAEAPTLMRVAAIYNRVADLIENNLECPVEEYIQNGWYLGCSSEIEKLSKLLRQDDVEFETYDNLPFGQYIKLSSVDRLIAAAEMLHCSVDYLLGRDVPENWPEDADCHGQSDDRPRNDSGDSVMRWNTGIPKQDGRYICLVEDKYGKCIDDKKYTAAAGWNTSGILCEQVVGWIPMPEEA